MNKQWHPVLIAGPVLATLPLAAVPVFLFQGRRAIRAEGLEAEAAHQAGE
jgi:hypothetical protein